MGLVTKQFTFSAGSIIVASEHNTNYDTLYNLVNGSLDNANVNSSAAIAASKLDLSTLSQTINASGSTWSDLGTVTTADINGGTIDGVTIGATSAPTVTDLGSVATCDINGGTIDGVAVAGAANQGDVWYDNGTQITRLTPGTSGQFLQTQGAAANPQWADGSGGVSFSAGDVQITNGFHDADTVITNSDIDTAGGTGATYIRVKEFIVFGSGTLRIKFDISEQSGTQNPRARIYRNGSAVGTERLGSGGFTTHSEDIAGWKIGDLCQLYVKQEVNAGGNTLRNFRIYSTEGFGAIPTKDTF